jgi:hypothetical protein
LHDLATNTHSITGLLLPDPHASRAAHEAAQPVRSHDMGIR